MRASGRPDITTLPGGYWPVPVVELEEEVSLPVVPELMPEDELWWCFACFFFLVLPGLVDVPLVSEAPAPVVPVAVSAPVPAPVPLEPIEDPELPLEFIDPVLPLVSLEDGEALDDEEEDGELEVPLVSFDDEPVPLEPLVEPAPLVSVEDEPVPLMPLEVPVPVEPLVPLVPVDEGELVEPLVSVDEEPVPLVLPEVPASMEPLVPVPVDDGELVEPLVSVDEEPVPLVLVPVDDGELVEPLVSVEDEPVPLMPLDPASLLLPVPDVEGVLVVSLLLPVPDAEGVLVVSLLLPVPDVEGVLAVSLLLPVPEDDGELAELLVLLVSVEEEPVPLAAADDGSLVPDPEDDGLVPLDDEAGGVVAVSLVALSLAASWTWFAWCCFEVSACAWLAQTRPAAARPRLHPIFFMTSPLGGLVGAGHLPSAGRPIG